MRRHRLSILDVFHDGEISVQWWSSELVAESHVFAIQAQLTKAVLKRVWAHPVCLRDERTNGILAIHAKNYELCYTICASWIMKISPDVKEHSLLA
jgi:hypothetical protein